MGRRRKTWDTVAIVGVGLIGGSIGMSLCRRKLARNVVGIGRNAQRLAVAKRRGALTASSTRLARGAADAELIIVCTPVARIVEDVQSAAAVCPAGAMITDVGSTKRDIVAALDDGLERDVRFLGSHPLAGGDKTGVAHARADLFDGRVVVMTPTRRTGKQEVTTWENFWTAQGAAVRIMSADAHDRALAVTSHLPHLIASVLSAVIRRDEQPLTATGWADSTRVAAGDPELWKQILMTNRRHLSSALGRFQERLDTVRKNLDDEDAAALQRFLGQAKRNRDALGN